MSGVVGIVECWICRRQVVPTDSNNVYLPCGDKYHDECLRRMARYLATVYGRTDMRCPRCSSFVPEHSMRALLWDMRRVFFDAWIQTSEPDDVFRVEIRNETAAAAATTNPGGVVVSSPPVIRYVRVGDMPIIDLNPPQQPLLIPVYTIVPPPAATKDEASPPPPPPQQQQQQQPPAYTPAATEDEAAPSPPPQQQPPAYTPAAPVRSTGQDEGRCSGRPGLRDLKK